MNTECLKLRLICSRARSKDQLLHANIQSILVPPYFRLVPIHFVCSGDGTDAEHQMGFALSHDFKNLLKRNGDKCFVIKVLL